MADIFAEIPDRDVFKASEVCEIAQVQPYVLRSWEQEFPNLGLARSAGGPRVYRRSDVERVLRIRQLVFGEGLTLAGARRRLEGNTEPQVVEDLPGIVDDATRVRISEIKRELRALLDVLDSGRQVAAGSEADDAGSTQPSLLEGEPGSVPVWPPKGQGPKRRGAGKGRLLGESRSGGT